MTDLEPGVEHLERTRKVLEKTVEEDEKRLRCRTPRRGEMTKLLNNLAKFKRSASPAIGRIGEARANNVQVVS